MTEKKPGEINQSKSQHKKKALELQALGEKLTGFNLSDLDRLPLPEKLKSAILEFKNLPNSHGAKKRQLQYIGKLMRYCEKSEIEQAILELCSSPKQEKSKSELTIHLCNLILDKGDKGINQILNKHSSLERQRLRGLYREFSKAIESRQPLIREKIENYITSVIS